MEADRHDHAESLAAFIVGERKRNTLTQAELADIAGVSERFIRQVEGGKETLRLDAIRRLLAAFGAQLSITRQPISPMSDEDEA